MTTHNHNHGAGIFNNVGRDQHIQNTILVIRPPAISAREAGKRTIREPYRDAIDSIHVILATLNTFPQTSTVMSLLQEFRSLETMVSFVGKVMGIISSSRLRDHSFFNGVEHHVFKYCQDLRRLKADISMYSDHIKAYMESRWWKRFLLLFSGYSWRPLYEQVKREVGKAQLSLVRFLHLFARHCRNLQHASKEYAELTRIIEDMRPILNTPARHVEVSTIWIREPTGDPWYAIPLNFCASWKDFTLVVTHYCEHGPGSSDVLRGNWEVVDVNKLRVIDKSESINEAMQPEMRFDIGIVIEFPSVMSRTCPFCGNNDIGPKLENGWVRCSNPACSQLFRMVTPTTNKSTRVTSTQTNVKGRAIPSPTVRNAESPVRGSGKASPTSTSARQHRVSNDTPIPQSSPHAQSPGEADIDDEDPPSSDDRSPPGVKFHRILAVISSTPAVLKVQVFDSSSSTNRVDASTPAMLKDPASDSSSSAASELPKASDLSSLTTLADSTPKTEIPKDEALDLLSITYPNGDATHPHQLNAQHDGHVMSNSKRKALLVAHSDHVQVSHLRLNVRKMRKLLIEKYYYKESNIVCMHDKNRISSLVPTRDNILREMDSLVKDCQPGDQFVFHFSGDVGQQINLDGSKLSGWNGHLETSTGPILDDELKTRLVDQLCPGSQLVAIFDASHSETLLNLPHIECHGFSAVEIPMEDLRVPSSASSFGQDTDLPASRARSSSFSSTKKPHLQLDTSFSRSSTITGSLASAPPDNTEGISSLRGGGGKEDEVKGPTSEGMTFYGRHCSKCLFSGKNVGGLGSDLPRVLAISACKDSEVAYEDMMGRGMTEALCRYLTSNPNPSLNRLFNGVSFKLFAPGYDRVTSVGWKEFFREHSITNEYQQISFSSLQRLNPDWKFSF